MLLVTLAELVVIAVMLYLGVTQVILPLWQRTLLFPMFRREGRLQHDLAEATEQVVEADLEEQIAKTAQRAESVRRAVRRSTESTSGPSGSVNQ